MIYFHQDPSIVFWEINDIVEKCIYYKESENKLLDSLETQIFSFFIHAPVVFALSC